jgi:hypothetical protein
VNLLSSKHGKIGAARASNIHLSKKGLSFKDLMVKWEKVLYTGKKGHGIVVPYNVGPVASGKVTVLGTGSSKGEVDDLFRLIKEIECLKGE